MWDGVDRRRFVRVEYPCLITIRKGISTPQSILTHTEDISIGGVRVIIRKRLGLMAEVDLELDLMDTLSTIRSRAIISWIAETPSGRQDASLNYDTGIKFIDIEDEYRRRIQKIVNHILSRRGQ
jgi:c-di-GMP-binding flagellar brake protein YcgR